ncbi:MAG: hypothetical protein A3G75_14880 [Verrucomicrobia bacterium RIFCSPLOWO2_12_FULL_64_8]|nr:MAG: hypothetical protein A3G75_14880 [Verrucomicrobia bacterium RIFCSPLOWO2_12_FULL_64_8]
MNFVHKCPSVAGGVPEQADEGQSAGGAATTRWRAVGEWLVVGLILANVWWTTLCLGGYRPDTLIISYGLTAAALVVSILAAAFGAGPVRLHLAGLIPLPFLLYGVANVLWVTPVPWLGWWDWLGWVQMAVLFWVVLQGVKKGRPRWALFGGLVLLGVVAVGLAAYQSFADSGWLAMGRRQAAQFIGRSSGPFGIPNSLAALLNLLVPPMIALAVQRGATAAQRVFCGYLAALFAFGAFLTVSRGAWLALGIALVAWPLLRPRRAIWRRIGWSAGVAAALLLLATVLYHQVPRIRDRVDTLLRQRSETSRVILWRAGWSLFQESPLLGTGAGSYDVRFEKYRPERFWDRPRWAHNDYLNTLSDYGILGLLLSFGLAVVVAWRMRFHLGSNLAASEGDQRKAARLRALRGGLLVGCLAFALQLVVDFNLKIPALAQTVAIAAALVAGTLPWSRSWSISQGLARTIFGTAAVAVIAVTVLWVTPVVRAEAHRHEARRLLDQLQRLSPADQAGEVRWREIHRRLRLAVSLDSRNAQAWSDLADAIIQRARMRPGQARELGVSAAQAAARALAQSEIVPEFWLMQGIALGLLDRSDEAETSFKRALELAPRRHDLWYYYAYHLSFRDHDAARRALVTCLRLDPWNEQAIALQKHLDLGTR